MGDLAQTAVPGQRRTQDEESALLTNWLEENLGCQDVVLHRQRRWRPILHAEVTQNGVRRNLFLKGDRTWPTHPYPLEYEMRMQRVMHENGLPIPAILGFCPDPKTIVMEYIEGGRDAGLMQEAIEGRAAMSDDRWQASLRYMEILADLHRIPAEKFVAEGAILPTNAREIALDSFERFHAMTETRGISDPLVEFAARWLRRNAPTHRTKVHFLTGDCGQFMSDGPNLTCIMDVEIGHLGDNMRDLACFRGRHPFEDMGDFPALYRHYERAMGEPNDYDAIAFHTVAFLTEAYYGPLYGMHQTGRGGDWVEGAVQIANIGRRCMEALAEIIGLELGDLTLPDPEPTPLEDLALAKLEADIGRVPESESLQGWERGNMLSIPDYLRKRGHYRRWLEDENLADIAAVIGTRPANVTTADADLTRFIEQADPVQDAALVGLFHRMCLRHCLVIAGPGAPSDHLFFARIAPILPEKKRQAEGR